MEEIEKVVSQLLPSSATGLLPLIIARLEEKGVEEVEDLKYVNFVEDLKGVLKEIPARKLKEKFDIFFSGGESSENHPGLSPVLQPGLSPVLQTSLSPVLKPGFSSDWAESFQVPIEKIPSTMQNKLKKNKRLDPDEYRELVRILVAAVFDVNKNPLKRHFRIIAKKVIEMFPIMTDISDDKLVGTGYDGLMRKMIARKENISRPTSESQQKKKLEKRCIKKTYGCVNFYPEQDDEEEQKNKKAALLEEHELLPWNIDKVETLMKETFALQRKDIVNLQIVEKIKKEWPFLFISRFALSHFKDLMDMDLLFEMENVVTKKIPELYDFLKSEGSEVSDPDRYLEALATYFSEDFTSIFRIFEDKSIKEVSGNESTPVSPYIAAFGEPYKGEKCCIVFIDRLEVSELLSLKQASALWFATFYIYGLEYPEECPATAEFIQRAFLGINPDNGSKSKKRSRRSNVNAKVCRITEKLCNYKSMWSS